MVVEDFIILRVRSQSNKSGKLFYIATLYSVTFGYTVDIFISEDSYAYLSTLDNSELVALDLSGRITKVVYENKPRLVINF